MGQKLILIVEDEVQVARLLKDSLKDLGYKACVALDGEEALRIYSRKTPSLILLDIALPGRDGYNILREIRQRESSARVSVSVPVIIQSGRGLPTEILCETEGISGFLHKPYGVDELENAINSALHEEEN